MQRTINHVKSAHACRWSIEKFAKLTYDAKRQLYFWTLTTRTVESPRKLASMWNHFNTVLKRKFHRIPALGGVRVFEIHPGECGDGIDRSHGLHIHFVTNSFLPVQVLRAMASRMGFGRIQVERVQTDRIQAYMTKYLTKQQGARDGCMRGQRLWSAFGHFKSHATRVKDVVYSSPFGDFFRIAIDRGGFRLMRDWRSAGFRFRLLQSLFFLYSKHSGEELMDMLAFESNVLYNGFIAS